jgi:hypothetical protein
MEKRDLFHEAYKARKRHAAALKAYVECSPKEALDAYAELKDAESLVEAIKTAIEAEARGEEISQASLYLPEEV